MEITDVIVAHFCPNTCSICWELFIADGVFCGDITNNSFNALDNSVTFDELFRGVSDLDVIEDGFASTLVADISSGRVDFDGFLGWRALMRACADDWKSIFFGDIGCDRWSGL